GRFFDIDPVSGRHRRFFDIDDLAGVRQEQLDVFEETHELAISLLRGGLVDGLRVDHPDGLANPAEYLTRLRARGAGRVWVEKILDPSEQLGDWPVCGTVGYEYLNDVCALFVDPVTGTVTDEDRAAVAGLDSELQRMLLLEVPVPAEFVIRFQQMTPAVMAKGVEDTAFYRYGRLLALNDVGGDPSRFGIPVERFDAANEQRAERFPFSLLTTQTHDAK